MKKVALLLILVSLIVLTGCDRNYEYYLHVISSNDLISVGENEEKEKAINFHSSDFNQNASENYSNIDFFGDKGIRHLAKVYKFNVTSNVSGQYNLTLDLIKPNKYVIDFLRVAIVMDEHLYVYKFYDEKENIFHKENDPDTIMHFKSKTKIFDDLLLDFPQDEIKEIFVFIWIEESESCDGDGNPYKDNKDMSYYATPINLKLEIK